MLRFGVAGRRWPLAAGFCTGFPSCTLCGPTPCLGLQRTRGVSTTIGVGFIGVAAMTVFGILHALGVTVALCFASRTRRPSFSIQSPLLYDGDQVLEVL